VKPRQQLLFLRSAERSYGVEQGFFKGPLLQLEGPHDRCAGFVGDLNHRFAVKYRLGRAVVPCGLRWIDGNIVPDDAVVIVFAQRLGDQSAFVPELSDTAIRYPFSKLPLTTKTNR
jgi:hypothetical protein